MLSHPVVILRHLKERRSKCSVQPFRWAPGFFFYNAAPDFLYDATGHLLLEVGAPLVSPLDAVWDGEARISAEATWAAHPHPPDPAAFADYSGRPILLLDATWRRLPSVARCLTGTPVRRGLPESIQTAYPRTSADGQDPAAGLATVEALYVALRLLGADRPDLLDAYRWKNPFLQQFDQDPLQSRPF